MARTKKKEEKPRPLPKPYQEEADKREKERKKALLERSEKPVELPKPKVDKMAKFIFLTLQQSMTTYRGTSGIDYHIDKGQPFVVKNKADIEFFTNNKRFERQGFMKKSKPVVDTSADDLRKELLTIKDLGEDTAEVIIDIYGSKKKLLEVLEEGLKLDASISADEQELIKKHYMGE